ncbi:hypothetical protein G3485_07495 [Shewanella baltica]|uniref:hypothetical protein n=1 Tax=Shewanella baltica TaxID=62322 RepID=UPI00217DD2B7|nr:hypothetical protein [Shewanella baltica]MCS6126692.1 hypothetical protein [Shewanella baltica]MCS6138765.1 hypothetical protein [Shewanella baltica]MCS6144954.1 hypothetical protein [Shewanella baltica]MCS6169484.1 hypothetical protein [Shewanella baltica]MCS6186708.1 hypothetical protein [Shewanella baltica]
MAFETISLGTQPAGTGGDTARTAFEKVNRNFLAADVLAAAMSQAQFEAIRAQNNEQFAASGFVHLGKHANQLPSIIAVNQGLWTFASVGFENSFILGRVQSYAKDGTSKTDSPLLNISGVIFDLAFVDGECVFKFPAAPDGKKTYNKSTGVITNHATIAAAFNAQAADPANIEVVTARHDMWAFEPFLEEVSETNTHVYPNGVIQSQATTMDGITTSASARPVTYYAVFDGDTTSKGKGLNFFALTNAQKKKVLANHKNNLYYLDDGRLVQWRLRKRTFAGAGNGDWSNFESAKLSKSAANYLQFSFGKSVVKPQGIKDSISGNAFSYPLFAGVATDDSVPKTDLAIYAAISAGKTPDTASGVNGECYILVCGTVPRLNKGAYHPSLNPFGAADVANSGGGADVWYNSNQRDLIISNKSCFDFSLYGDLNSGYSGRPDAKLYDGIYSSGQGGVCRDLRYSANSIDVIDHANVVKKANDRTYRGFEKLKLTTADSSTDLNISVGGNFLVTEVIATNAAINATPDLLNGWVGFKNLQPPTGSISDFELSRSAVTAPTALRSTNNGASWSAFIPTFNAVNNSVTLTNEPAANIVILQYQAFAKQTESAPNAAIYGLVPYNVFASSDYRPENGALLGESLIGKVLKNNSGVSVNNKSLLSCSIDGSGKLTSATNFDGVTHSPLTLGAPANNSPAFKVVSYLANINQQAVPHFSYIELKHNGTNWGDDGKVTIVDNQSTKTDLNGNTVLVGTAKLKEPIGWIKNKV